MISTAINKSPFKRPVVYTTTIISVLSFFSLFLYAVLNLTANEYDNVTKIFLEKGNSLIKTFEASTRAGFFKRERGGRYFQTLIEETATRLDIKYIFVTDKSGYIVAHSDKYLIGKTIDINKLEPKPANHSFRIVKTPEGDIFEVLNYFRPLRIKKEHHRNNQMKFMMDGWIKPEGLMRKPAIIFVGLNIDPLNRAKSNDFKTTILITLLVACAALISLISIFWFQNYLFTKKLLSDATIFANHVIKEIPAGILVTNEDGNIIYFNRAAIEMSGINIDNSEIHKPDDILPDQWDQIKSFSNYSDTPVQREIILNFASKKSIPVSLSVSKITDSKQNYVGTIAVFTNLEEILNLKEEMRKKEKLAAIGSLSAGIAHEIRNPLSSIKGLATYFSDLFKPESPEKKRAVVIVEEVERINRVITEMLEIAKPSAIRPIASDIEDIIDHALKLIEHDTKTNKIKIIKNVTASKDVKVDPDKILQAFLNIFLNAIQAMTDGGELSIKTTLDMINEFMIIKIADTGTGINEKDAEKIFNPYHTTKNYGTGIGLSIVKNIIEAHGGIIELNKNKKNGSEFILKLPI